MMLITGIFETYLKLNEAEEHELQEEINELNQEEVEQMLEITTSWHEKGRQEGRQEGRLEGKVEGRQEGQVELLIRLLSKRYGSLPEDIIKQIQKLDIPELNNLAEAILDFEGIEDLKNWLG